MSLFITQGESEFEIRICPVDGEWEGRIIEYHSHRLVPAVHLRHNWTSLEAALAGVQRRWQRLFPELSGSAQVDFRDAVTDTSAVTGQTWSAGGMTYPYTAC